MDHLLAGQPSDAERSDIGDIAVGISTGWPAADSRRSRTARTATSAGSAAWLCFRGVDLSAVRQAQVFGDGDPVELRVDDPFPGPMLVRAAPSEVAPMSEVDGVHDLYLVFPSAGTTVRELVFT